MQVRRRNYDDVVTRRDALYEDLHIQGTDYQSLRSRLDELGKIDSPITATKLWHWQVGDPAYEMPELFFYGEPPVVEAAVGDYILFTGLRSEIRELNGVHTTEHLADILQDRTGISLSSRKKSQLVGFGSNTRVVLSASLGRFWGKFYGTEDFLEPEETITIPRAIVGTGSMRNYNYIGGESLDVKNTLRDHAALWGIPFIKIPAFRN